MVVKIKKKIYKRIIIRLLLDLIKKRSKTFFWYNKKNFYIIVSLSISLLIYVIEKRKRKKGVT